jgi:hypothetical protein
MAGVHWRSDAKQALLLGERVTISMLRDQRNFYGESLSGFRFTRFDGDPIPLMPSPMCDKVFLIREPSACQWAAD